MREKILCYLKAFRSAVFFLSFFTLTGTITLAPSVLLAQEIPLNELRDQFKRDENSIIEKYKNQANQPGANVKAIEQKMFADLEANRKDYSALAGRDNRYTRAEVMEAFEKNKIEAIPKEKLKTGYIDEMQKALKKEGLKLQSTGGSADLTPKHLNADLDAVIVNADGTPASPEAQLKGIEILKEHPLNKNLPVNDNAARFDVLGRDVTIWKPDTPEGQAVKLGDPDAFKTEGGKYVTRNPGAMQDAYGEYLDNRAKFEAARVEGDLKTMAKSLEKAAGGEASGVKKIAVDPKTGKETFARESQFINQEGTKTLYEQTHKMSSKKYGTAYEAGIIELTDTPEQAEIKIEKWQQEAQSEMERIAKEAERKGKIRDAVRENFQESYEKAGGEENLKRAQEIKAERERVAKSNQKALEVIEETKVQPSAKETYTGGRKGPGDAGYEAPAGGEQAAKGKKGKAVSLEEHVKNLAEGERAPSAFDDDPAVREVVDKMLEEPQKMSGEASAGELETTKTDMKKSGATASEETPVAKGKPSANLLEGGKASSGHTPSLRDKALGALEAANKLDDAAVSAVGVSELSASSGSARRALNAAGETAMHGLGAVGAAAEGGAIGYGIGQTLVNLKDAYYEEDEGVQAILMQRSVEKAKETAKHAATSAATLGGLALAPQTGGLAVAGVAGYAGGRAILEGTETGKAVDKAVQDKMTETLTIWDDLMRKLNGDKTVSEQERENIDKVQDTWARVLNSGRVELQPGATKEDLLVLVERMVRDGKTANLNDLGDLKSVLRRTAPARDQVPADSCADYPGTGPAWDAAKQAVVCICPQGIWSEEAQRCVAGKDAALLAANCSKFPGTKAEWDESEQKVHCNCTKGKWSNSAARCVSDKDIALNEADCSKFPGTKAEWDEADGKVRCNCVKGKWSNTVKACVSDKDAALAKADCSKYPNSVPQWDEADGVARCNCIGDYVWNKGKTGCHLKPDIALAQASCTNFGSNVEKFWDSRNEDVRCRCMSGYEWDSSLESCVRAYAREERTSDDLDHGGYDTYDTGNTYDDTPNDDYDTTDFVNDFMKQHGQAGQKSGASSGCTAGRTAAERMINQALGCSGGSGQTGGRDQWGDAYKGYQGASGGYSRPSGGQGQGVSGGGAISGGPPEPTGCIMEGGTTYYIGCPIGDGRWKGGPKNGSGRIYNSYQEMLKNERRVP